MTTFDTQYQSNNDLSGNDQQGNEAASAAIISPVVAPVSTPGNSNPDTNAVTFASLGLADPILKAVTAEGYTQPTLIQHQAIPAIMAGGDLIGIAQTGTGKTAAFVLPLLHAIIAKRDRPKSKHCTALILAPTRELAQQINDSIRTYGRFLRVSSTVVVGGAKPGPQIRALAQGLDIVVATPGRLLDHMQTNAARLEGTSFIVLDEADQMMDLGFMPAIRRIMMHLPKARQTMLFSATMPKPIRALANEFLHQPREVAVSVQSRPVDAIEQRAMLVDAAAKKNILLDILRDEKVTRSIVFTRTKRGADKVSRYLEESGLRAAAIHGNKSQAQRERALNAFRHDKVRILVATDIAARGIDIDGISHVINFEIPNVPEAYVHRIGRTARAGATGIAISLCDYSERGMMRDIERLIGRSLLNPGAPPPAARQERSGQRSGEHRGGEHRGGEGRGGEFRNGPRSGRNGSRSQNSRNDFGSRNEHGSRSEGGKSRHEGRPHSHGDSSARTGGQHRPAHAINHQPAGMPIAANANGAPAAATANSEAQPQDTGRIGRRRWSKRW